VKCKDCKFWDCWGIHKGYCRVNAPSESDSESNGVWPSTDENDWCGQFIAEESLSVAPTAAETTASR
jgi:hypothetical protein